MISSEEARQKSESIVKQNEEKIVKYKEKAASLAHEMFDSLITQQINSGRRSACAYFPDGDYLLKKAVILYLHELGYGARDSFTTNHPAIHISW